MPALSYLALVVALMSAAPGPSPTPAPSSDLDKDAVTTALAAAAVEAKKCNKPGGPTGIASIVVTFAPAGVVSSANIHRPPFAGTPVGGCIAEAFRAVKVPAFTGASVTMETTAKIP